MPKDKTQTFLAASTEERLRLILDGSYSEDVKAYLGERAFEEYVKIAQRAVTRLKEKHLGIHAPTNLIFIPGVMGSLLESRTLGYTGPKNLDTEKG